MLPGVFHFAESTLSLLRTRALWMLAVLFVYGGMQDAFGSTTLATCVGTAAQRQLQGETTADVYAALSGTCCYAGRMFSGLLLIVLFAFKFPRDHVLLLSILLQIVAYFGAFLLLPSDACVERDSDGACSRQCLVLFFRSFAIRYVCADVHTTWWQLEAEVQVALLLIGSALLGFGHGCFMTPKNALITRLYNQDPAPVFALDNFLQALACGACLLFANHWPLPMQLLLLLLTALLSLFFYCKLEWKLSPHSNNSAHISIS